VQSVCDGLELDPAAETGRIVGWLRDQVRRVMRRQGAVVGISGGVDSSVVLALVARAFTAQRVVAVMMPDSDSDPSSERLARDLCARLGLEPVLEAVSDALEGFDCYRGRDEAIRRVYPDFDPAAGDTARIVLPGNLLEHDALNIFSLEIIAPDGTRIERTLPAREYLQIVAASNFKQRARMAMLYYHADLNNFAVVGTANRNEHRQGFFVKYGDGGVDVSAIAHLLKTQVYQLAAYLGVPEEIQRRQPTTDTYSAQCTQEEFFFRMPFAIMDRIWHAQESGLSPVQAAVALNLTELQVERVYRHFTNKQRATEYLRMAPVALPVDPAKP